MIKNRNLEAVGLAVAIALMAAGCAAKANDVAPVPVASAEASKAKLSGVVGQEAVTATATVKSVNHETRKVEFQRPDGSVFDFEAGPEVRNLAQVKAGDEVTVTYYQSMAYQVKKAGDAEPGTTIEGGVAGAELGAMPAGLAAQVVTLTATIIAIDKKAKTVTLKAADGETTTVTPRDPSKLNQVVVGDLIEIQYTEAVGISLEHAAK